MNIERKWSMPSKNTFNLPMVKELIDKYKRNGIIIKPFENKVFTFNTDINSENYSMDHNMDAMDFLHIFQDNSVEMVLFEPPFSPKQISNYYKKMGKKVEQSTTQASFWSNYKKEISRVTKPNGIVMTNSWNSGGIGKKYGFEIIEILLIAHGGWHNDSIVTIEKKIS